MSHDTSIIQKKTSKRKYKKMFYYIKVTHLDIFTSIFLTFKTKIQLFYTPDFQYLNKSKRPKIS